MNRSISRLFILGAAATAAACASTPPPTVTAAEVTREQCDSRANAERGAPLIRSATVLRVDPLYSNVPTAYGNIEERVNGAQLLVRPPPGVSPEDLTRDLQCHSAALVLGQVSSPDVADDPYWLPNSWVNIEVRPENGNYLITVSADTIDKSLEVLRRANRYAEQHMLAANPAFP
jgi:hypothetical protein